MSKHLSAGSTQSCGCLKSRGELKVIQVLQKLNIDFITQKEFNDCKNILPLKFDFYLPKYKIALEYQGKQHYESIQYFGGEERFQKQIKTDSLKEEWCKNNNIKLIKILYTDYKDINEDYTKNNILKE